MASGERSTRKSVTFDQSMLEEAAANADGQLPRKTTGTVHQNMFRLRETHPITMFTA